MDDDDPDKKKPRKKKKVRRGLRGLMFLKGLTAGGNQRVKTICVENRNASVVLRVCAFHCAPSPRWPKPSALSKTHIKQLNL